MITTHTQPTPQPAGDAAIGRAFRELLADPTHRWRKNYRCFIDAVEFQASQETARAIQAGKGDREWSAYVHAYETAAQKHGHYETPDAEIEAAFSMWREHNRPSEAALAGYQPPEVEEGCTPTDAKLLRKANHALADENGRLREALQFYADKDHFMLADEDAWDTVSGEPPNFWCDEAGTATIEDGTFAKMAIDSLAGSQGEGVGDERPAAYERGGKLVRTLMEAEKTQFYGDGPIFPLYRHPPVATTPDPAAPDGDGLLAAATKAREVLQQIVASPRHKGPLVSGASAASWALGQALSNPRVGEAVPFAWHVYDGTHRIVFKKEDIADEIELGNVVNPVFAAPPTAIPDGMVVEAYAGELEELRALINTPELHDFAKGAVLEAAHQRDRWGNDHDAGKEPADWFWLLGYLAGKALKAHNDGNTEKALHHTISSAAALANWHGAILGTTNMRPGIDGEAALAAVPGSAEGDSDA